MIFVQDCVSSFVFFIIKYLGNTLNMFILPQCNFYPPVIFIWNSYYSLTKCRCQSVWSYERCQSVWSYERCHVFLSIRTTSTPFKKWHLAHQHLNTAKPFCFLLSGCFNHGRHTVDLLKYNTMHWWKYAHYIWLLPGISMYTSP